MTCRGVFVTIDGPSGAGKSTITRHLHDQLTALGHTVHTTAEPTTHRLGQLARQHCDTYRGHALACLVAADRYHHLTTDIRPHLAAGQVVLCDRYVASTYVLQQMDGVPLDFLHHLNTHTDPPDLTVILTIDPANAAARITARGGAHTRFHTGPDTSHTETTLYREVTTQLADAGHPVLILDTTHAPAEHIATQISDHLATLLGPPPSTP